MSGAILAVERIRKDFGGLVALDDVSIDVEPLTITALIGPNGAGKTTLFNVVTGVYAPSRGRVWLEGQSLNGKPPQQRVRLGIVRTFQNAQLFDNMTVMENVMVGRHTRSRSGMMSSALRLPSARREEEEIFLQATRALNLVGLGQRGDESAANLPFGQRRLVAIARALATEPRVLMLDEPGAGLNTLEKRDLADLISRISEMGITILLVEHDMSLVMRVAEQVVVLEHGRKIAEGTPDEIRQNERVIRAYLGDQEQ
jgi:branched-chain amino acid transport system ATP-binding protein